MENNTGNDKFTQLEKLYRTVVVDVTHTKEELAQLKHATKEFVDNPSLAEQLTADQKATLNKVINSVKKIPAAKPGATIAASSAQVAPATQAAPKVVPPVAPAAQVKPVVQAPVAPVAPTMQPTQTAPKVSTPAANVAPAKPVAPATPPTAKPEAENKTSGSDNKPKAS